MATFHPSEYPSCPHEITTRSVDQIGLIAAHDWCRDADRSGIYAMYRQEIRTRWADDAEYVFCFSNPNVAIEFKLKFG